MLSALIRYEFVLHEQALFQQLRFDHFFAGDLVACNSALYRIKGEIDQIHAMIGVKRCQIGGLDQFGLAYDHVLHGAWRRWRVRLYARRRVRVRIENALVRNAGVLPLRSAMRKWQRLLSFRPLSSDVRGAEPEATAPAEATHVLHEASSCGASPVGNGKVHTAPPPGLMDPE